LTCVQVDQGIFAHQQGVRFENAGWEQAGSLRHPLQAPEGSHQGHEKTEKQLWKHTHRLSGDLDSGTGAKTSPKERNPRIFMLEREKSQIHFGN
jgi:hypothetical protein